jgi:CRP-like cAMP-binding protein
MTAAASPVLRKVAETLTRRLLAPDVTAEMWLGLLEAGRVVEMSRGHQLCAEGEPPVALWVLVQGQVRVERKDGDGKQQQLATLSAPTLVGHMGLVDRTRRSATVNAEGDIVVVELDLRTVDRLVGQTGDVGFGLRQVMLCTLTRQLAAANTLLSDKLARPTGSSAEAAPAKRLRTASDLLDGWDLSAPELDLMTVVVTEDQRRHPRNRRP